MSARRYNMSNLRAFLTQGFSAEELRTMCYDDPELYPVIEQLGEGMGKSRIVSQILEFCQQKLLLDRLLSVSAELNPARYALHQPYYLGGSAEPDASTARTLEACLDTGNRITHLDKRRWIGPTSQGLSLPCLRGQVCRAGAL
jgi:hypothetical protein